LRLATDPARLPFDTTASLPQPDGPVGQERAMRAIAFGAHMTGRGYNLFVSGPKGTGRHSATGALLGKLASSMPVPPDWCYVHNFADPSSPTALYFSAGQGAEFRDAMAGFVEALKFATRGNDPQSARTISRDEATALIRPLWDRFATNRGVPEYLEAVWNDVISHSAAPESEKREERSWRSYQVNLLVDNSAARGAPVVSLGRPSLTRLTGKVEHVPVLMTAVTDFMLIRPGALHQANGGFLLIDAQELFQREFSWETLKRALNARRIVIESPAQLMDRSQAVTLRPDPIALDLKIVLFGEPWLYHRLRAIDPDFADLFKVQADFATTAERTDANCAALLQVMASLARREGLRAFSRTGAARLLDEATRLAADAEKISVRTGRLADIAREADHFAQEAGHALIHARDIVEAIEAKEDRAGRYKALEHELIKRNFVFIDTDGAKAGQVNGLTVLSAPGFAFGVPARITAQVRPGNGRVIDIERLARLSGPSHIKGVHILSGYLNGTYSNGHALSVSASVAIEQSYAPIDGDSASAAELAAILSAIADVPLKQCIAVTGSINQHGVLQPIGGVNEKIEGFFDVCSMRGLGGHHGVIIPKANIVNLMLRDDVVQAAREGRFRVHAAETMDEVIALLSGMSAGARGRGGFPRGSFNARVHDRLVYFARPRILRPVRVGGRWPLPERERIAARFGKR
jgi:lon-related putative ATP-dependent protease